MKNRWLRQFTAGVLLVVVVATVTVLTSSANVNANPPGSGWELVFEDNFAGNKLDSKKWSTCYFWVSDGGGCTNGANKELQWYQPDDVIVDNGTLRLRSQRRQMKKYEYTSGMISSHDKFSFKYGYTEMRAKMPKGKGLWTAFWLASQQKKWPPEIDILEHLGAQPRRAYMNVHYGTSRNHKYKISNWVGSDYSAGYHTFAVQWSPEQIVWYIDGIERKRFEDVKNIPDQPMYVLANLAVGESWIKTPPDRTTPFPSNLEIDYIKVWQRQ